MQLFGIDGDNDMGKIPPQDLHAEQATLGAMLLEPEATARALAILEDSDFYREAHRTIYRAMQAVDRRKEPVDLITVCAELRREGVLEEVGGSEYLTALIAEVPTTAHVTRYATIVAEKSLLRKLISAGMEIAAQAYDNPPDVRAVLDEAEERIFRIAERRISRDFVPLGPIMEHTFDVLDKTFRSKHFLTGLPTGLVELDDITGGLQKGHLVIVAGRPSMGKSSLCLTSFALAAATGENPQGVGIFSLEMSRMQVAEQLLCSYARVDAHRLRRGHALEKDWGDIAKALAVLPEAKIFIDDTPMLSITEMRSKARRLKAEHDIGLLIVDYIQLATTGDRLATESRHQELALIARALKGIARELDIPVVACSQLSRGVERREDKRPLLSDLAESGAIEAEADLVCFLYRPKYYERRKDLEKRAKELGSREAASQELQQKEHEPEPAEIIIQKHRTGPVGTVNVMFHPRWRLFFDVERVREEPGTSAYVSQGGITGP
ncbi:MAG: replicative DNA helicase [Candidatus Zipacnadales bacterium]